MARSPRKSSTRTIWAPRRSVSTRPAGLLPPTGGVGGGGAISAALATVRLGLHRPRRGSAMRGRFRREDLERDDPARRQALGAALVVFLRPRLLARAAVD